MAEIEAARTAFETWKRGKWPFDDAPSFRMSETGSSYASGWLGKEFGCFLAGYRASAPALASLRAATVEGCAQIIDAECERVLSKQYPDDDGMSFKSAVNANLRMVAVLLPELSVKIRALAPPAAEAWEEGQ